MHGKGLFLAKTIEPYMSPRERCPQAHDHPVLQGNGTEAPELA